MVGRDLCPTSSLMCIVRLTKHCVQLYVMLGMIVALHEIGHGHQGDFA